MSLKQIEPYIGEIHVDEIHNAILSKIEKVRLAQNISVATLRRDFTALSKFLKYARQEGWCGSNLAKAWLEELGEKREPIVLPEPHDIELVLSIADTLMQRLTRAGWLTGRRPGEPLSAERKKLNHDRTQLEIIGQGHKRRMIDLESPTLRTPPSYALFRELPAAIGCPQLFTKGGGLCAGGNVIKASI